METKFGDVTLQVISTNIYMGNKRIFITVAQPVTAFYVGEVLIDVKAIKTDDLVTEIKDSARRSSTFETFAELMTKIAKKMSGVIQIRYNFDLPGVL